MAYLSQIKLSDTTYDIGAWKLRGKSSSSAVPLDNPGDGRIKYYYNVNNGLTGNMPATNNANGILHLNTHGGEYSHQLGFSSDGNIYQRATNGSALSSSVAWKKILNSSNYTDYTVTKTGGGASGTWGINITGNAATATKATQDGDGAVISSTYLKLAGGTMTGTIVTPGNDSVVIKPAKNNYDQIGAADCKFWKIHASTFIGNLTGTASIASTLAESALETTDAADAFLAEDTFKVAKVTAAATAINNDGMILSAGYSGGWGAQIWLDDGSGAASMRIRNRSGATTWNGWRKVWLEGDSVTGAVWNDYAEYREADTVEAGYVLIETGKDTLVKSNERLSHFAGISSDTWGFSQGETDKAKTPIAVAGRVLVYPYQDRNNYKPGDCVCAAPGGTVDIMTREEVREWPDRIVGIVSCVPDYEEWGGGKGADRDPVKVNGRIWIKVK